MSSFSRQVLENYISTLFIKADRVLGAGDAQQGIKTRVKSFDVNEYLILDLETPHQSNEKVDIVCDLNESIASIPKYIANKDYRNYFDIVFCLEVSEYLWNIVQAMKNINYFLKQGGICYMSFHTFYCIHNPKEQDYMRLTKYGIIKIMKETGFKIEELIPRVSTTDAFIKAFQAEKMKMAKHYNHAEVGYICKIRKI